MKKNLGIFGPAGSGKGVAAKYIARKYNYKIINMGNIVRALAKKEKLKPTRKNLEKIGEKYSKIYKTDFVIEHALEKAKQSKKPVILDGIRKPNQAKLAKQKIKAILILIDAKPEIRFKRMKARRRTDFPKTFEIFRKEEKQEERFFNLKKTFSMADYKVDNSKDKKYLFKQLDKIMKKINR
ncbi:MAG: nucleoside monophosphate kinase [Candidatus Pacearchaeota archaeon]